MLGDFNDIRSSSEQWGSVDTNSGNIAGFVDASNDCELIDLPSTGPGILR